MLGYRVWENRVVGIMGYVKRKIEVGWGPYGSGWRENLGIVMLEVKVSISMISINPSAP